MILAVPSGRRSRQDSIDNNAVPWLADSRTKSDNLPCMKKLLLALSFGFVCCSTVEGQPANANPSTAAKTATTANKAGPMELQETCAKQAEHFFQQFLLRNAAKNWLYDYTNNYNPDLNRCFVLVEGGTLDLPFTLSETLFDAYTRKAYGFYFKLNDERKGSDPASFKCHVVKLPAGEEETCKSDNEFKKLVEFYMGK